MAIFFWFFNKEKEETYEKFIEMSKNNNYVTGTLVGYEYFSNHYKLLETDLRKRISSIKHLFKATN